MKDETKTIASQLAASLRVMRSLLYNPRHVNHPSTYIHTQKYRASAIRTPPAH